MPAATADLTGPALVPIGEHEGKPAIALSRPVTVIGSRNNCRIHLTSSTVSKAHAVIVLTDTGGYVADLKSRTKTIVNGKPVFEHDLRDGDELQTGRFRFRFVAGRARTTSRFPAAPNATLRLPDGSRASMDRRTLLIGRRGSADVALADEAVSTAHAVILERDGKRFIRDLGSRTGTRVNRARIHQEEVTPGATLQIGQSILEYTVDDATALEAGDGLASAVPSAPISRQPEPADASGLDLLPPSTVIEPELRLDPVLPTEPELRLDRDIRIDREPKLDVQSEAVEADQDLDTALALDLDADGPADEAAPQLNLDVAARESDDDRPKRGWRLGGEPLTDATGELPSGPAVPIEATPIPLDEQPTLPQLSIDEDDAEDAALAFLEAPTIPTAEPEQVIDTTPPADEPRVLDEIGRVDRPNVLSTAPSAEFDLGPIDVADPDDVIYTTPARPEAQPLDEIGRVDAAVLEEDQHNAEPPVESKTSASSEPLVLDEPVHEDASTVLEATEPEPASALPEADVGELATPEPPIDLSDTALGRELESLSGPADPIPMPEPAADTRLTKGKGRRKADAKVKKIRVRGPNGKFAWVTPDEAAAAGSVEVAGEATDSPAEASDAAADEVEAAALIDAAEPSPLDFDPIPAGESPEPMVLTEPTLDEPTSSLEDAAEVLEDEPAPQIVLDRPLGPTSSSDDELDDGPHAVEQTPWALADELLPESPLSESTPDAIVGDDAPISIGLDRDGFLGGAPLPLASGLGRNDSDAMLADPDEPTSPITAAEPLSPDMPWNDTIAHDLAHDAELAEHAPPTAELEDEDESINDALIAEALGQPVPPAPGTTPVEPAPPADVSAAPPVPLRGSQRRRRSLRLGAAEVPAATVSDVFSHGSPLDEEAAAESPDALTAAASVVAADIASRRGSRPVARPVRPGAVPTSSTRFVPPQPLVSREEQAQAAAERLTLARRRRARRIPLLLLAMFVLMGAIALGVIYLVPALGHVDMVVRYRNLEGLALTQREQFMIRQHQLLEEPQVRQAAVMQAREAGVEPGFLRDLPSYGRVTASAKWSQRPEWAMLLSHESDDVQSDGHRVVAMAKALYAANESLQRDFARLSSERDRYEADVARSVARIEALRRSIQQDQDVGDSKRTYDVEVATIEEQIKTKMDAWGEAARKVSLLRAEVASLKTAVTSAAPGTASPDTVAADAELAELQKQLDAAAQQIAAARGADQQQAELARGEYDKALEQAQADLAAVRAMLETSPELKAFVESAQGLLDITRNLSQEALHRQQQYFDRMQAFKQGLEDRMAARRLEQWQNDKLRNDLLQQKAFTERQFNAATANKLPEAEGLKLELTAINARIEEREAQLGNDPLDLTSIKDAQEVIDFTAKAMAEDRAKQERMLDEQTQSLQRAAIAKLPTQQQQLARQFEERLQQIAAARKTLASTMTDTANRDDPAAAMQSKSTELTAKIEARKKALADASARQLTEQQEKQRQARIAAKEAELASATAEVDTLQGDLKVIHARRGEAQRRAVDASVAGERLSQDQEELQQLVEALKATRSTLATKQTELARLAVPLPVDGLKDLVLVSGDAGQRQRMLYGGVGIGAVALVFSGLIVHAARAAPAETFDDEMARHIPVAERIQTPGDREGPDAIDDDGSMPDSPEAARHGIEPAPAS